MARTNGIVGEESYYVQSLSVNGRPWMQNWVTHGNLTQAEENSLRFELGPEPVSWETAGGPPSPGHVVL